MHSPELKSSEPLFSEHYGVSPAGCPRFVELSIDMRREVVKELEICSQCMANKEPVKQGYAHAECKVSKQAKESNKKFNMEREHACN